VGLFRGIWAPFRGALFVARHKLWWHVLLPFIINLVLAVGAGLFAADLVQSQLEYEGFWQWIAVIVVALLLFIFGQPVIAAPFVDILTEKVEVIVTGKTESMSLVKSIFLALWHGLLKSGLYAVGLLVTAVLFMTTGVGGLFGTVLTALFLAYDGFDYPLARRISGFRRKWRYLLLENPGQTLGYATGASVMFMVPFAALIAPPFAAVGATLAFLDAEAVRARKSGWNEAKRPGERTVDGHPGENQEIEGA